MSVRAGWPDGTTVRERASSMGSHEYYALVQVIGETEHMIALIRTRTSAPDEIWLRCGDSGSWHAMDTSIPDRAAPLLLRPRRVDLSRDADCALFPAHLTDRPLPAPASAFSVTGHRREACRARRAPRDGASRYEQLEISINTRPPPPIPPPSPTLHPPGQSSRHWFLLR